MEPLHHLQQRVVERFFVARVSAEAVVDIRPWCTGGE